MPVYQRIHTHARANHDADRKAHRKSRHQCVGMQVDKSEICTRTEDVLYYSLSEKKKARAALSETADSG